jgi:uncharacterized protein (TIGR03437 family)
MLTQTLPLFLFSALAFAAPSFPVLTYSTYLRDSFTPKAIATDASGNVYMAGNGVVDPATSQRTALVLKLDPQGTRYLYVRYLGGSVDDSANAIAVDAAGNAYVAGATASPDFPVTGGGHLGTAPAGSSSPRSFLVKLDPAGDLVFADLLGGAAASTAQAVAVNAAGEIVVSGMVSDVAGPAFSSTPGAFTIPNTANHPYLLKLDPGGTKTVFSATGIGGSALAVDPPGNIYVAGSTTLLDYPTTPGSYQPEFPKFQVCSGHSCTGSFQGFNQYVTKVDPTGSTLIYSTAVSGNGNTANGGLAVDSAGNVYLTGYAGPNYPYTVTPPALPVGPIGSILFFELPFLSKLDAAGKTLLFSVPVGGAGVQADPRGAIYVSGAVGSGFAGIYGVLGVPALANIPSECLPENVGNRSAGYVTQVDAASGDLLGTQFIGGSTLATSAVALFGSTLWIAGATTLPDFLITPNAITLPNLPSTPLAGAYLGAVDFSQPQAPSGTPQIFCIVDSADLHSFGAAGRNQLLTVFGTGLGPATGVSATGNATTTLAGVNLNFGSVSAPLLYVSSTQVNFAVPPVDSGQSSATMQLTVDNAAALPRLIPLTNSPNPSLFENTAEPPVSSLGFVALALNADGSMNSAANPAKPGSVVSVFANGLAPDPRVTALPPQLSTTNGWSVTGITPASPFVSRIGLVVPSALVNDFFCPDPSLCAASVTLYGVGPISPGQTVSSIGEAFGGVVYVSRTQ